MRRKAVDALGKIGDAHAVEPLLVAGSDIDDDVRKAVPIAIIKIGTPAVEPLIAALKIIVVGESPNY